MGSQMWILEATDIHPVGLPACSRRRLASVGDGIRTDRTGELQHPVVFRAEVRYPGMAEVGVFLVEHGVAHLLQGAHAIPALIQWHAPVNLPMLVEDRHVAQVLQRHAGRRAEDRGGGGKEVGVPAGSEPGAIAAHGAAREIRPQRIDVIPCLHIVEHAQHVILAQPLVAVIATSPWFHQEIPALSPGHRGFPGHWTPRLPCKESTSG